MKLNGKLFFGCAAGTPNKTDRGASFPDAFWLRREGWLGFRDKKKAFAEALTLALDAFAEALTLALGSLRATKATEPSF